MIEDIGTIKKGYSMNKKVKKKTIEQKIAEIVKIIGCPIETFNECTPNKQIVICKLVKLFKNELKKLKQFTDKFCNYY